MTKCHTAFLAMTFILVAACKGNSGKSLSEYGAGSDDYRRMMFEKYVAELLAAPPEEALALQDSTVRAAEGDSASFRDMVQMQKLFLYDVNSPYRCEDYCLPVLEAVARSPFASDSERFAAKEDIASFSRNRLGTTAADFTFTLRNGRKMNLHSVKAYRTLLFFSNPGCNNCKEITDALSSTPGVDRLLSDGTLAVVNIYPDDDMDAWYGYVVNYPSTWISGYCPDVDSPDGPYLLRAIPTLYLLDRDKRVLLKDAPLERILQAL